MDSCPCPQSCHMYSCHRDQSLCAFSDHSVQVCIFCGTMELWGGRARTASVNNLYQVVCPSETQFVTVLSIWGMLAFLAANEPAGSCVTNTATLSSRIMTIPILAPRAKFKFQTSATSSGYPPFRTSHYQ